MKTTTPLAFALAALLAEGVAWAQPEPPAPPPGEPPTQPAADQPVVDRELPERDQPELATLQPSSGGLTSEQVARRTIANSATVRAKQAEYEAAQAKVRQTAAQFFPRLTLSATYTRLSPVNSDLGGGALVGALNPGPLGTGPCAPGSPQTCVVDSQGVPVAAQAFEFEFYENNYELKAELGIPISDYILRLSHAAASSSAGKRAARIAVEAEKLRAKTDAKVVYYNWVRAQAQLSAANKSLERTHARIKDAEAAFQLGAITKADLMRLQALGANTELMVAQAQSLTQLSEQQLKIVTGDTSRKPYRLGENVDTPPRRTARGSIDQLVHEAHRKRLELKMLDESTRALRRGSKAVAAGTLPRLDAFGQVVYANPNSRIFPQRQEWRATWAVGLSATWVVSDVFVNSAGSDELDAQAKALEAQRRALRDGIRTEVTAHYLTRERAKVAIETSRRALAAAEEAYRVATDLYKVGRATTTELIEAESDLLQARLGVLNALVELKIAEVQLWHAVGRDVSAAPSAR